MKYRRMAGNSGPRSTSEGGLTRQSDKNRARSIQESFCSGNMTLGEAQRRLLAINRNIIVSYWTTCDNIQDPPGTQPGIPSRLIPYRGYFYSTTVGYVGMWSYTVYDNLQNAIYSDTINPAAIGVNNTERGAQILAMRYIDSLLGSADPPPEFVPVPGPSPIEPPPTVEPVEPPTQDPVVDPPAEPPSDFETHSMYDCATGQEYIAYTQEDHEKYAALGYVHDLSECKIPEDGDEAFALFGLIAILAVAYVLYEAFKGESPSGD